MKKERKLDIDQAAVRLAAIIDKHLEPLSPAERKQRIKKAHARVQRAVAKRMAGDLSESFSKSSQPGGKVPSRLIARSR